MKNGFLFFAIIACVVFFSNNLISQDKQQKSKTEVIAPDLLEGINLLKNRSYDAAIEKLNAVIVKDEKNHLAFYNRGLAYMYKNEFELAIHDFDIAIKNNPKFADSYNNRGLCNYYINENELALKDLDKAVSLDKNFAEAYLNRASVHINLKNFDTAIKDLSKALTLNSKNPEVYTQRARLYYMTNKFNEAVADYTKVITMGSKNYKTYYNRGNAYFKMNKFKEAIKDYTEALKLAPDDAETINNRSAAYHSLGDIENAKKDKEALVKLRNKNFPPIENIKWKTYSDKDSLMFFEMPADWNITEIDNNGNKELIISPNNIKVDLEGFAVGLTTGTYRNVGEYQKITTEGDMINNWKASTQESTKGMHFYTVEFEKQSRIYGHSAVLIKAKMQATPKHYKFDMLEYIVAINDNLFYLYFQAPENVYEYYAQIFMKAIESVRFDETSEIFRRPEE